MRSTAMQHRGAHTHPFLGEAEVFPWLLFPRRARLSVPVQAALQHFDPPAAWGDASNACRGKLIPLDHGFFL